MATPDELHEAFLAGFKASAEGFNGEYPFYQQDMKITENDQFQRQYAEFLADTDIEVHR